jgi:hypothetical protein
LFILLIGMVELFEGRSLKRLWTPVFLFFFYTIRRDVTLDIHKSKNTGS